MSFEPSDAEPFSADNGPVGVVVSHGFTGLPASMRDWAEHLAGAGLSVRLPLLPGHGTRWQDANAVRWQDWVDTVVSAYDDLRGRCDHVFVAGLSMGGTLALRLAQVRPDVAGLMLVNPSVFTLRKQAKLVPLLRWFVPSFPPIASDIKKPGVREPAYDKLPVKAFYQLSLMWEQVRADLPKITQPLLVFTSREDHIVERQNSETVLTEASSTDHRQVWLDDSYHVATMDNDAPEIFEESVQFVQAHAVSRSG